jgi:hypothetical protein
VTCSTGKTEFSSGRAAKRALKSIDNPQGRMHAYPCEEGGHWHFGHSNAIGSGPMQGPAELRGYRRPKNVFTGFIVVGNHQVVFGNVCLTCAAAPHTVDPGKPSLLTLDLPDQLLAEVWEAGEQRVVDTLLTATPDQIDAIKIAWTNLHGGHS